MAKTLEIIIIHSYENGDTTDTNNYRRMFN